MVLGAYELDALKALEDLDRRHHVLADQEGQERAHGVARVRAVVKRVDDTALDDLTSMHI